MKGKNNRYDLTYNIKHKKNYEMTSKARIQNDSDFYSGTKWPES